MSNEKKELSDQQRRIIPDDQKMPAAEKQISAKDQIKALEAEIKKIREEAAAAKKAERELKAALEAEKKAASKRKGDLDLMAEMLCELGEKGGSYTKDQLFALYLEKLGIAPEDDRSTLKRATLDAQLGTRITKRIKPLGYSLISWHESGTLGNFYSVKKIKE